MNNIMPTFNSLNFDAFKLPMIVVYDSPSDFKGKFVARIFDVDKITPNCMVKDSFEELLKEIPHRFTNIGRQPEDDPVIKCVFI